MYGFAGINKLSIYSIAVRTANQTIAQTALSVVTPSTGGISILETGVTLPYANASIFGFGHPGAGTTLGGTSNGQPENMLFPISLTQVGTSWSTQPTIPNTFTRIISLPATVGAGVVWTFPRGVEVVASNSYCWYNISPTCNAEIWYCWDE